ncbi:TlpA family protein disulfide reductase [Teredinibacter sp. KSP-S5-2]|uniref:TlpA family protein disulfide reductase n=1 Tax=Teredinibacter sp. KSP-S5-2 TaxID=3034506 RepID=UPI0029352729|nr:TlpA family protein disulfide reductase [Teredinibacter sp. KSP-S5-2]WNO10815.1 TlpA family protein disulfide reductase [Teredinibacter sp. KSP-S5-2]
MRFISLFSVLILLLSPASFAERVIPSSVLNELKQQANIKDGELVYVDFWASWCTPCRKSFPWMNEMQAKYANKGLRIIAVNLDQEKALADSFLRDVPVEFGVIFDPKGKYAKEFKVKGMPSSYMLSPDGKVAFSHRGFFENKVQQYEDEISSLLNATGSKQ